MFSGIFLVQYILLVSPEVKTLPKLIPGSTKWQQAQPSINWSKSKKHKHCNSKWNVFKVNSEETRTMSMVSLFLTLLLTLYILISLLITLNIFHISYVLYTAKKKEQIANWSLFPLKYNPPLYVSPTYPHPPPHPQI